VLPRLYFKYWKKLCHPSKQELMLHIFPEKVYLNVDLDRVQNRDVEEVYQERGGVMSIFL
jgi:hypothetical protein